MKSDQAQDNSPEDLLSHRSAVCSVSHAAKTQQKLIWTTLQTIY